MATKVIIGETEHQVPRLKFKALKRSWPYVEAVISFSKSDPMFSTDSALRVVAAGLTQHVTGTEEEQEKAFEEKYRELEDALESTEIAGLATAIDGILIESGMLQKPEDKKPGEGVLEGENPSTETSTSSSPSSSLPDVKEEAGTVSKNDGT